MNDTLILVWACIAIVGAIAIIIVKLYFSEDEEENNSISTKNPLQERVSSNNNINKEPIYNTYENAPNHYPDEYNNTIDYQREPEREYEPYIVPEIDQTPDKKISYSSQNQVLIHYDDRVEKFQEPITQTQRDIMTQREENKNELNFRKASENKHELKDLFTIDELIKESKRKDDEREKESKIINKEEDASEIKESIIKKNESKNDANNSESDIKESIEKMHEIANAIKKDNETQTTPETTSQKDITEAIKSASQEKKETPEISETRSITDAILNKKESTVQETLTPVNDESVTEAIKDEEIESPTLKTPTKVEEDSISVLPGQNEDYEFGAPIESADLFEDENGELSDLDYRKDLAKITNTFRNSKIIKDVREKLSPPSYEEEKEEYPNEDYIRNVNNYVDEYEPIINETHFDYEMEEDVLRQENTRKVFDMAKNTSEELKIPKPKEAPEKSSLKILINNNEEVLCKGDEIIFKHDGETYSSKVYSINGDDIKVKYRRQTITIKPSDVKKIY